MVMPGGVNPISASMMGTTTPVDIHVLVNAETADALNRARDAYIAAGQTPWFDFYHERRESAGTPIKFEWADTPKPGVYVECQTSKAGIEAIAGKNVRSFSMNFVPSKFNTSLDKPATVKGAHLIMGSLTNIPAFKRNLPISAQHQNPNPSRSKSTHPMKRTLAERLAELAGLTTVQAQSRLATLETEIDTLEGQAVSAENADDIREKYALVAALNQHIAAQATATVTKLTGDNATLQTAVSAQRAARADAVISAATTRGVFPPQPAKDSDDAKRIAKWRELIIADDANAALLESMGGRSPVSAQQTSSLPRTRMEQMDSVEVTSESLKSLLQGYVAAHNNDQVKVKNGGKSAKLATEAGRFYAKNIRRFFTREDAGWDAVISASANPVKDGIISASDRNFVEQGSENVVSAANTLGTLAGVLVVQRSLDLLKYDFPMLSRISTDFSAESARYNQTIETRLRAIPTVGDYDPISSGATGYTIGDNTTTDVPIIINRHKFAGAKFDANELAGTQRLLFPEQEEGIHYAMALEMVNYVYSLITAANFTGASAGNPGYGIAGAGATTTANIDAFARPTVIAMKTALNLRGVTGGVRTLLLSSLYHGQLESDTTIVGNLINRDSGSAIGESLLPRVAKFQPIEAENLPTTGNLAGFGMRADALALAVRLPNDYTQAISGLPATALVQTVTNPDTGMSVMVVMHTNHTLGVTYFRIAWMYGAAKGNPAAGQLLLSK